MHFFVPFPVSKTCEVFFSHVSIIFCQVVWKFPEYFYFGKFIIYSKFSLSSKNKANEPNFKYVTFIFGCRMFVEGFFNLY